MRRFRVLTLGVILSLILCACQTAVTPTVQTTTNENTPAEKTPAEDTLTEDTSAEETPVENGETTSEKPAEKQTIVVALAQAPISLDPADHRNRESETVIRNMFDGLVTRDTRNGVHMELAETLEWADETTLEISLRQDVKFHDGSSMTADDVVFTFERIIQENAIEYPEPHTSPRKGLIAPLESIEKIDDYTVVMHFSAAWPPALQMLVHQQIVPKAYIEEVGTEGFVNHPIGTGPFKFVSATASLEEVVMERFDDYYGGSPDLEPVGTACVERAIFQVIPEASTRTSALIAGEVQIIQAVPQDLISQLSEDANLQVKTAPGTQPKWIELNVNKFPFNNLQVRLAMNYAIDKDLLIESIYNKRAVALPGPLSPFNNFVNKSLSPYPYDPNLAISLLQEAGWGDVDGDGILDKGGEAFVLTIDTLEEWRPLAEAVASMYQEIGIDASVRFWEYSVIKPDLLAGERLAYLDDWGDSAFDPVGHFEAKWHGFIEGESYGRGNFSGYNNERVNELIKMGETTVNETERQTIYDEAQQIVYDEAPAVFLVLPEEVEASTVQIRNWEPASDSRVNLHDVCLVP